MEKKYQFPLKLFVSLMLLAFVPFVYQLVRTNLISNIPDTKTFSIAGHIEWFDLIDETLQAFLIMPLYALFNRVLSDKEKFRERIGQTAVISFVLYSVFSAAVLICCGNIVKSMNTDAADINAVTAYLRLETIGFIIGLVSAFASVLFVLIGKSRYVYILLSVKVAGTIIGDLLLIPAFQVNGVALSNSIVGLFSAVVCVIMLKREGLLTKFRAIPSKDTVLDYIKVGIFSGGEIFLNNIIYAGVVCKMVNAVAEQGNYWVANNVIWGLMLIPVNALVEIIKRDCKEDITRRHLIKYAKVCGIMFGVWVLFLIVLEPFLSSVMGINNPQDISHIIYTVIPFYVPYTVSQVFGSIFIGKGKTYYNVIISIIVNLIYYPIVYNMVAAGVFTPNIEFICYMFGFGMLLGMVLDIALYIFYTVLEERITNKIVNKFRKSKSLQV